MRGKKGRTFFLHFVQHMLSVAVIFTIATIFVNYDIVFGRISSLLSQGQSVDLSSSTAASSILSQGYPIYDWSAVNSPLGQMVIDSASGGLVAEMNKIVLYAGIVTISLLIFRESWSSVHQSRLTFLHLESSIRGVLYRGCTRAALIQFNSLLSFIQAIFSYIVGLAFSAYLVIPTISALVHDTFFNFLISTIPFEAFVASLVPVILTFVISILLFAFKIRMLQLR